MAKQKDPSITVLNGFGYNVVKLPRVGIEPLDVIGKDQTNQLLGPLLAIWQSQASVPVPSGPNPAADINGQKSGKLDISFGLKVLANVLGAFGATVPSLNFAYAKASKVEFSYANVTSTSVTPFAVGDYLTKGQLNTASPVVKHYFMDPDCQAFLIVDVLKSNLVSVTATDDQGTTVGVDIPAIQGVVGANVSVGADQANTNAVTYKGNVSVTFGFLASEIEFDGTSWSIHSIKSGDNPSFGVTAGSSGAATAVAAQAKFTPVMLSSKCLIDLI